MSAIDIETIRLGQLAKKLSDAYRAAIAAKYNRTHRPHKRFEDTAVWHRVAQLCHKLDATPEVFIEAQFRRAISTPFPNMLSGKKAEANYRAYLIAQNIDPDLKQDHGDVPTTLLLQKLDEVKATLQMQGVDPNDKEASAAYIVVWSSQFEALPSLLLYGEASEELCRVLQEEAKTTLEVKPYYYDAIKKLNLNVASISRECC